MPQTAPETRKTPDETVVVWLHGDHLADTNPALIRFPDAPAVFVFDEPFLRESRFSFARLFFLYESAVDALESRRAPTSVRRGDVADELIAFAKEHGAARIVTTRTIGSHFEAICETVERRGISVTQLRVPDLVEDDPARVPDRFSSWWRDVGESVLGASRSGR